MEWVPTKGRVERRKNTAAEIPNYSYNYFLRLLKEKTEKDAETFDPRLGKASAQERSLPSFLLYLFKFSLYCFRGKFHDRDHKKNQLKCLCKTCWGEIPLKASINLLASALIRVRVSLCQKISCSSREAYVAKAETLFYCHVRAFVWNRSSETKSTSHWSALARKKCLLCRSLNNYTRDDSFATSPSLFICRSFNMQSFPLIEIMCIRHFVSVQVLFNELVPAERFLFDIFFALKNSNSTLCVMWQRKVQIESVSAHNISIEIADINSEYRCEA